MRARGYLSGTETRVRGRADSDGQGQVPLKFPTAGPALEGQPVSGKSGSLF